MLHKHILWVIHFLMTFNDLLNSNVFQSFHYISMFSRYASSHCLTKLFFFAFYVPHLYLFIAKEIKIKSHVMLEKKILNNQFLYFPPRKTKYKANSIFQKRICKWNVAIIFVYYWIKIKKIYLISEKQVFLFFLICYSTTFIIISET